MTDDDDGDDDGDDVKLVFFKSALLISFLYDHPQITIILIDIPFDVIKSNWTFPTRTGFTL